MVETPSIPRARTRSRSTATRRGAACAFAFMLVIGGCGDSLTVSERVDRAQEHRVEGELRAAMIELRKALQKDPNNVEARYLLGRVYVDMDRMEGAEKEFSRALDLGHPRETLIYWLGRALLGQGEYEDVLADISAAEQWDGETRAGISALRAQAAIGVGDKETATEMLSRAEKLAPDLLETRVARIELELQDGDLKTANENAERLVAAHPEQGRAWETRARVALIRQDLETAEKALTKAMELRFSTPRQLMQRAQVRLARGDIEGAKDDLGNLRDQAPADHPGLLFTAALVDWETGRETQACDGFADVVRRAPGFATARVYLAACQYREEAFNRVVSTLREIPRLQRDPTISRLMAASYLALGDDGEARSVIAPVVEQHPEDAAARGLLARAEMGLGNTEAGLHHLKRLAELRPEDSAIQLQLGVGFLRAGANEEGRVALSKALRLQPGRTEAGSLLVLSQIQAGAFEDALATALELAEEQPDSPIPWTLRGVTLLEQGDREAARLAFNTAVDRSEHDPAARHHLARMALEDGELDQARSHYRAVLESQPEHVGTLLALARLEATAGHAGEAEAKLREAVAAAPDRTEPRLLLGRLLFERGKAEEVIDVLRGPDAGLPQAPEVLELAARAYLATGKPREAVEPLRRLVALRPDDPQGFVLLASAYEDLGNKQQVRAQLEQAAALDPDMSGIRVLLARLRIREGRLDDARRLLDSLPDEVSDHAWVLDTRAELALTSGNHERALKLYERVLEVAPSSAAAVNLSEIYRAVGKPGMALQVLQRWLEEHPSAVTPRMALGNLHFRAGRQADAIEAYREVLRHSPAHAAAMNNLAWLLREKEPEQSLRYAEKAVEVSGGSAATLDTLGVVLIAQGDAERAVRRLREAVEKNPRLLDARYHLSQGLVELGERDEARRILATALDAEGAFSTREEARALLAELGGAIAE